MVGLFVHLDGENFVSRSISRTASAFRILLYSILGLDSNVERMSDFSVDLDPSRTSLSSKCDSSMVLNLTELFMHAYTRICHSEQ
jgi:hypothetical protein